MLEGFTPDAQTPVRVAGVLVDVDLPHLDRPLDYLIPDSLTDKVSVGVLVRVRLAGRLHNGWVLRVGTWAPTHRLTAIERVVSSTPLITEPLLTVARRIADRNLATLSQTLSLAVPARHAATEKEILAAPVSPQAVIAPPDAAPWTDHPLGGYLLHHLQSGEGLKAVWTALGPTRDKRLVACVQASLAGGRGVVLVVPTSALARRFATLLEDELGIRVGLVDADSSVGHRYGVHLHALAGHLPVVVGTRSVVWTPMARLGLLIVWDDGDDRLREQRAPRCDALDVAVARAHVQGCALLVGAYSRSVKAQALVASGWAVGVVDSPERRRILVPRVRVLDELDAQVEGPGGRMRIPVRALRTIREGLESGPVLVHVAASGYVPVVSCARCGAIARCDTCSGPLAMDEADHVSCRWCSRSQPKWRCRKCSGTLLRTLQVGSDRTGEELARAMPAASVLVSSTTRTITRAISAESRIVIATAGAEPRAEGGYAALVVLDARAIAGRAELWAPEEALRRWFNAFSLVRPGAPALIVGGVESAMAQTLIRCDPVDYAARLLDERAALGYFPAATLIAIDGAPSDVHTVAGAAKGELIGTIPLSASGGSASRVRALVRARGAAASAVLDNVREVIHQRSSRKLPPVKITVNPPELF